jgi:hypothetical protein
MPCIVACMFQSLISSANLYKKANPASYSNSKTTRHSSTCNDFLNGLKSCSNKIWFAVQHVKQERNLHWPVHPCTHGQPTGWWFSASQKSDAKDLVIGLQFAPLRFCWKLVVVALCRVCASATSPTLSVFGLSVWLNSTHQSTKRNGVHLQQFFLKLLSVASLAPGINSPQLRHTWVLQWLNSDTHELSKRTWDKQGIGSGPEMNRALGLDLGWTGHWDWTWDEQGIWTGPGMNRVLVVTLTHRSYKTGPGMNRALGVPWTHVRYTGPGTNMALGLDLGWTGCW